MWEFLWVPLLLCLFLRIIYIGRIVSLRDEWKQRKATYFWLREHDYVRYGRSYLLKEEAERRKSAAAAAAAARTPFQKAVHLSARAVWWVISLPLRIIRFLFSDDIWRIFEPSWQKEAERLDWLAAHGYDENICLHSQKNDPPRK